MAYGPYRLQFLHISDLHAKGSQEKEPWRRRRVLGNAWLRNLETLHLQQGGLHFTFLLVTRRNLESLTNTPKRPTSSRRSAKGSTSGSNACSWSLATMI